MEVASDCARCLQPRYTNTNLALIVSVCGGLPKSTTPLSASSSLEHPVEGVSGIVVVGICDYATATAIKVAAIRADDRGVDRYEVAGSPKGRNLASRRPRPRSRPISVTLRQSSRLLLLVSRPISGSLPQKPWCPRQSKSVPGFLWSILGIPGLGWGWHTSG